MRVKTKEGIYGTASEFNVHAASEAIVGFDHGDMDSMSTADLDVEIKEAGESTWMSLHKAFRRKLVVPNNHNTRFGPPINEAARERGYNP